MAPSTTTTRCWRCWRCSMNAKPPVVLLRLRQRGGPRRVGHLELYKSAAVVLYCTIVAKEMLRAGQDAGPPAGAVDTDDALLLAAWLYDCRHHFAVGATPRQTAMRQDAYYKKRCELIHKACGLVFEAEHKALLALRATEKAVARHDAV